MLRLRKRHLRFGRDSLSLRSLHGREVFVRSLRLFGIQADLFSVHIVWRRLRRNRRCVQSNHGFQAVLRLLRWDLLFYQGLELLRLHRRSLLFSCTGFLFGLFPRSFFLFVSCGMQQLSERKIFGFSVAQLHGLLRRDRGTFFRFDVVFRLSCGAVCARVRVIILHFLPGR